MLRNTCHFPWLSNWFSLCNVFFVYAKRYDNDLCYFSFLCGGHLEWCITDKIKCILLMYFILLIYFYLFINVPPLTQLKKGRTMQKSKENIYTDQALLPLKATGCVWGSCWTACQIGLSKMQSAGHIKVNFFLLHTWDCGFYTPFQWQNGVKNQAVQQHMAPAFRFSNCFYSYGLP